MSRVLRYTITLALISGYAAGAEAAALQQLYLPAASSGAPVIKEMTGKGKEPRRPVWAQRRHLPLVHQLSMSPAEAPRAAISHRARALSLVPLTPCLLVLDSDYFSSRCNKPPPRP
jgi:hypothetical protein